GALRDFDRAQQQMALQGRIKLAELNGQIKQIDDDYKDLFSRLTADAKRAADGLQAIADATAAVDQRFADASHALSDEEYALRERQREALAPLNAEVKKYSD